MKEQRDMARPVTAFMKERKENEGKSCLSNRNPKELRDKQTGTKTKSWKG